MNILPHDKQIEIIAALCEGVGQRAVSRLTETDRKTVARLALAIGRGCAEMHDRMMVGLHVHRIECDELWAYVGHKRNPQKGPKRHPSPVMGDQYTYVALASSTRAIIGYLTGKRDGASTDQFIQGASTGLWVLAPFHPRWSLLKIALAPFDRRPISEPFMLHLSVAKLGKWQWVSRCTGRYFLLSP